MEGGFLLFGERGPLALEAGSQPVQVEVIAAVVERGCFTVDIAPIGTDLSFLIESRTIGAKESEVLHLLRLVRCGWRCRCNVDTVVVVVGAILRKATCAHADQFPQRAPQRKNTIE